MLEQTLARLRPATLDRALIAGTHPASSGALAARARLLSSTRFRALLADGLNRMAAGARRADRRMPVRPRLGAARGNERELRGLAALVRGGSPVDVRGLAILDELLTDGCGPAYTGDADTLGRRLREARAALAGATARSRPTGDLRLQ